MRDRQPCRQQGCGSMQDTTSPACQARPGQGQPPAPHLEVVIVLLAQPACARALVLQRLWVVVVVVVGDDVSCSPSTAAAGPMPPGSASRHKQGGSHASQLIQAYSDLKERAVDVVVQKRLDVGVKGGQQPVELGPVKLQPGQRALAARAAGDRLVAAWEGGCVRCAGVRTCVLHVQVGRRAPRARYTDIQQQDQQRSAPGPGPPSKPFAGDSRSSSEHPPPPPPRPEGAACMSCCCCCW